MEERTSLALAVKLKKIYEAREDQFLTFPLGVAYQYRDLDFMREDSTLSAQDQVRAKAGFARLMNAIPEDGEATFSDSGRLLWDETKNVLIQAEFATSTLSTQEEKQLAQAIDYLTDEETIDGTKIPVPSDKAKAYDLYKEAYFDVWTTYLNEEVTVKNAEGQEGERLKQIWEGGRKQQLKRLMDDAMQEWINLGFKNRIEAQQQIRNALEMKKSPILYQQAYLNEIAISESADPDSQGIPFCVTFYSPPNTFDKSLPWIKVDLIKEEIESLIRQAPASLKGVFSGSQDNADIESLSLEYKYVDVERPWFRPEFFHAKYWRLPYNKKVCDGKTPRTGTIPAYITGLLAVRNITITKKRGAPAKENVVPILHKTPVQKMAVMKLQPLTRLAPQPARPATLKLAAPVATLHPTMKPSAASSIKPKGTGRSTFAMSPIMATVIKPKSKKDVAAAAAVNKAYVASKFLATPLIRAPLKPELVNSPITAPSPKKDTVTTKCSFDGVTVMAYVCRRLPKSPDPASNLTW